VSVCIQLLVAGLWRSSFLFLLEIFNFNTKPQPNFGADWRGKKKEKKIKKVNDKYNK